MPFRQFHNRVDEIGCFGSQDQAETLFYLILQREKAKHAVTLDRPAGEGTSASGNRSQGRISLRSAQISGRPAFMVCIFDHSPPLCLSYPCNPV